MTRQNWNGKTLLLIQEACRHGETRLAAQMQLATSADQRATVLAGIYVAAATGIIGAVAVVSSSGSAVIGLPLYVASGATAAAFLCGAILCVLATLPVDFWMAGNEPEEWYEDIEKNTPLEVAIGEQMEHFNDHILDNKKTIDGNAWKFMWGALIGIAAPLVGILTAGLVCLGF